MIDDVRRNSNTLKRFVLDTFCDATLNPGLDEIVRTRLIYRLVFIVDAKLDRRVVVLQRENDAFQRYGDNYKVIWNRNRRIILRSLLEYFSQ